MHGQSGGGDSRFGAPGARLQDPREPGHVPPPYTDRAAAHGLPGRAASQLGVHGAGGALVAHQRSALRHLRVGSQGAAGNGHRCLSADSGAGCSERCAQFG